MPSTYRPQMGNARPCIGLHGLPNTQRYTGQLIKFAYVMVVVGYSLLFCVQFEVIFGGLLELSASGFFSTVPLKFTTVSSISVMASSSNNEYAGGNKPPVLVSTRNFDDWTKKMKTFFQFHDHTLLQSITDGPHKQVTTTADVQRPKTIVEYDEKDIALIARDNKAYGFISIALPMDVFNIFAKLYYAAIVTFMDDNYKICYGGYQNDYEYHFSEVLILKSYPNKQQDDSFKVQESEVIVPTSLVRSSDSKEQEPSIFTRMDQTEVRPGDSEKTTTATLQSLLDFSGKLEAKQSKEPEERSSKEELVGILNVEA
ncbi:hypothetical protein L1987_40197 [Smallanthus sonchifolius]|uniref:Uncharacterized protein n=1 Tax=Smallanthus sonchifolius TaxID=185202 RepID=A0ACB9GTT1_9ASTR|nr:hypothetical protein L1987_40197 [Smallanthus sonchifolius]